jgi:2-phosphosulfolactate phosphatase
MQSLHIGCEWGEAGLRTVLGQSDVIVIVDVLSFCTCVDVTVSRGATVIPHRWKDESAGRLAAERGALLAGNRGKSQYSLSPVSLMSLREGSKLVLASPNGATLSMLAGDRLVFAACLRNAAAIAKAVTNTGKRRVSVIAAGEQASDGTIRFALEDWLGAGAVIDHLEGEKTSSASLAADTFGALRDRLSEVIASSPSGRELIERGFPQDVEIACGLDCSSTMPVLRDGAYVSLSPEGRGQG